MQKTAIVIAVVLAGFFVWVIVRAQLANRRTGPYYLRKFLFTPAEQDFLRVLETVLPAGVRVFGKVRLEDIFGVVKGLDASERQAARNRINRKHVDFLLVRANDLAPAAGIELDDSSHEEEERQQRDALVDSVFASAGLPLLHVPVQKSYDAAELKAKLRALLAREPAPRP
jgi:hypothetical protein